MPLPSLPALMRQKSEHGHHRVTFIELFFDLVFVFAITQLSHGLIEHFDPVHGLQTAMLTLALWWVWIFTTWVTNWLEPEKLPVRSAMLAMLVVGLVMSAAIPGAFKELGLVFAASYAAIQVGRTLFFLWSVRGHETATRNFQRIFCWLMASACLWVAGGLNGGVLRYGLWGATFAKLDWSPTSVLAFLTCAAGSVAMWWLYFDEARSGQLREFAF